MVSNTLKEIVFVSEIRSPNINSTSTHLMTESILTGFKENNLKVTFLAICECESDKNIIENYYSKIVDRIIILPSFYSKKPGKYTKLFSMLNINFFNYKYKKILCDLCTDIPVPDIIVSHTPSYEAVCYAKTLKYFYPKAPYYQYWSDPMALSGILPDNYSLKRFPFYYLESKAYKYADQIIFGTKTLYYFNSVLYKKHINKMRYVDVPYLDKADIASKITRPQNEFIYAGNYYSSIRNILPLYNAFNKLGNNFHLTIFGDSDLALDNTENVTVNNRISAKELENIEQSFKNSVCLLNHSCIQIPGKTFYQIDTDQNIIVITDGAYKSEIIDYLNSYGRFIICDNNEISIANALVKTSQHTEYRCPQEIKEKYSPKNVAADLLGFVSHLNDSI